MPQGKTRKNIIAEQKIRTQRILGELIKQGKDSGEIASPESGRPKESVDPTDTYPKTLSYFGISRDQSSAYQKIASIPEDQFEAINVA